MNTIGYGTSMAELVVSDSNPFLGRKVSELGAEFTEVYNAAILTVKGKNWDAHADKISSAQTNEEQKDESAADAKTDEESTDIATKYLDIKLLLPEAGTVSDHILGYGDTILVVTTAKNISNLKASRDFFVVSPVGEVPIPMTLYTFIPVVIFFIMLILAATETLDIAAGSMMVAAFFFLGGWIKAEEIPKLIDLRLLMLIGLSLSFATAMTSSGLALKIASGINDAHPTPFAALLLIYAITLLITELVSNNAAAALMYPIAVALADQLKVNFKTFAMAVLIAATAGFMSPIGYQTHVMVWAPGGYKFWDFVKFGFFPDIAYWIVGCAIIVAVYPFEG